MDSNIPEGSIPIDQFEPMAAPQPMQQGMQEQPPEGSIPVDQFQSLEDTYGTPKQQAIAGLEGVSQGLLGPLAPMLQKAAGADMEASRLRKEANPFTHGLGEAAGFVGGALTGTGEAAALGKVGEAAEAAAGLGKVSEATDLAKTLTSAGMKASEARKTAEAAHSVTYGAKVGSSVVKNAAEMAVFQSGDEATKKLMGDPDLSAESAAANIGLAALLGGTSGGIFTGAVSPLWESTVAPKLENFLDSFKTHLNGNAAPLADDVEHALSSLGVEATPVTKAGLSTNATARDIHTTLNRGENKEVLEGLDKLKSDVSHSVTRSLGIAPEEIADYSAADNGHAVLDSFKREYDAKYAPIADAMEKREAMASNLTVPDSARLDQYGQMLEKGMEKFSVNSPYYKLYEEYGNRLLDEPTIGQLDKLTTEIYKRGKSLAHDDNTKEALTHIKSLLQDFKEDQILKSFNAGKQMVADRAATNASYSEFAKMSDELASNLGVGRFRGAGALKGKLSTDITPELLLKKFSIKNNADFLPFLEKHFPETLQTVLKNERMDLIKPAVLAANKHGDVPIDIKKLSDIISKKMAGNKSYIEAVLPPESIQNVQHAKTIMNALPQFKDSGTPAGLAKMFSRMPSSAMASIAWLMHHNPISSALIGETTSFLGKHMPDAARLSYLKFVASEATTNGVAFKAMTEFIHAAQKGEKLLSKASANVLKPSVKVLTDSQMPSKVDIEKLDKLVAQNDDNPNRFVAAQNSSKVGHYLPEAQQAISKTSAQAMTYLSQIKPKAFKPGALDKEIEPSSAEKARYDRALTIAQQPAVVLQHIKNGTVLPTDLIDLKAMYPSVYNHMAEQLIQHLATQTAADEVIPYKTRMGLSLFLAQPLDNSMTPESINAAQPKPQMPQQSPGQQPKSPKSLGKSNKSYMTASQSAESRRND